MNNLNSNFNLVHYSNEDVNKYENVSANAAVLNYNYEYGDNLLTNEFYTKNFRHIDKKCDKK